MKLCEAVQTSAAGHVLLKLKTLGRDGTTSAVPRIGRTRSRQRFRRRAPIPDVLNDCFTASSRTG